MTRLLLVRHAESEWNASGRLQGRRDPPLSARGRRQAVRAAELVAPFSPTAATTSPLARARATAQLLGWPDARQDPAWEEADLGEWSGLSAASVIDAGDGRYAAWRTGRHTPPAGEPWEALRERVAAAVARLAADGGTQLVVTHGGPIRAVCNLLLGLDPLHVVPAGNASLSVLELDDPPRLRLYNLTAAADPDGPQD